jgi:hypothetical protein
LGQYHAVACGKSDRVGYARPQARQNRFGHFRFTAKANKDR